jgi:glutathione S-transferase
MARRSVTLYSFVDFDRGSRVRWLCHEIGLDIVEKRLNYTLHENRSEKYRAIHPFGLVPAIEYDGQTIWESGAICQFLVEAYPDSGLAPLPNSPERAKYLSWMFFATSTFDRAAFDVFYNTTLRPNEGERDRAIEAIRPLLDVLNDHFRRYEYLLGERFRLPDLVIGHALALLKVAKLLDDGRYPPLYRYLERLAARPAAFKSKLFATV